MYACVRSNGEFDRSSNNTISVYIVNTASFASLFFHRLHIFGTGQWNWLLPVPQK